MCIRDRYTDALVGKYTIAQLESLVMDNRNKDWVRAYPLAPFAGKARKKEVDARLRFLKAFWLSSDTQSGISGKVVKSHLYGLLFSSMTVSYTHLLI